MNCLKPAIRMGCMARTNLCAVGTFRPVVAPTVEACVAGRRGGRSATSRTVAVPLPCLALADSGGRADFGLAQVTPRAGWLWGSAA